MATVPLRKYKLYLSVAKGLAVDVDTWTTGNTIVIEELQMTASIKKGISTHGSSSDSTTISIYNLDEETKDFLMDQNINEVILEAGYSDDADPLPVIYQGSILKVTENKDGVDVVTELTCSSGMFKKKEAFINQTFTKGTSLRILLTEIVKTLHTPYYIELGDKEDTTAISDITLNGETTVKLDKLTKTYGLKWFYDNNIVVIVPKSSNTRKITNLLTLEPSNVIGSLTREVYYANVKDSKSILKDKKDGFTIKTYLTGMAYLGGYVQLIGFDTERYTNFQGFHLINEITHTLDFKASNSWYTEITVGSI